MDGQTDVSLTLLKIPERLLQLLLLLLLYVAVAVAFAVAVAGAAAVAFAAVACPQTDNRNRLGSRGKRGASEVARSVGKWVCRFPHWPGLPRSYGGGSRRERESNEAANNFRQLLSHPITKLKRQTRKNKKGTKYFPPIHTRRAIVIR
jgi:hypothetical protein